MGVFDDKKFEQLDWMTQITETIESELNGLLARLPDRIEFGFKQIMEHVNSGSRFSIQSDNVVRNLIRRGTFYTEEGLTWEEENKLVNCFKFEMSPEFEIDIESRSIKGTLALVKVIPTLSDEELQPLMGLKGMQALNSLHFEDKWPLDRINEMLDVLGKCEDAMSNRSHRKKMARIKDRLSDILANNEWRIRDCNLANKIGCWIAEYISTGNLAALTNFCKLKVMTHNNMPIYSIEEEK